MPLLHVTAMLLGCGKDKLQVKSVLLITKKYHSSSYEDLHCPGMTCKGMVYSHLSDACDLAIKDEPTKKKRFLISSH